MSTKLTTNSQRYTTIENLIQNVADAESNYYFFIGNHNPAITTPPDANTSEFAISVDTYNNMIAGKKITKDDMVEAIRYIPYLMNVTYDKYDDNDLLLGDKNYFVITDEGSYRHVYKCLDNNMGALSTAQPNFAHITGANTFVYQTADGYRWKYMYSVASSMVLKFATSDYFPVFANAVVSNSAQGGTVDIVVVEGTGQKYDNYVLGTLSTSNIRVGGNNILYEIANNTASLITNFYVGCLMYLTTGTGAGGYSRINAYVSNNDGKYVVLANSFPTSPLSGTQYEIYPEAKIYGTGVKIVNCAARALINSLATNSVFRVEILNRGSGYDFIYAANVVSHESVSVVLPAELRAINSPPRGHGFNPAEELFSNSLLVSVKLSNSENNTIPANNSFKQIGIIKDPLFANVSVEFLNKSGVFSVGETAFAMATKQIEATATITTTSQIVMAAGADFVTQLANEEFVFLKSSANDAYQLATLSAITNSSEIILSVNGFFACTAAVIYTVKQLANAIVTSANNTNVLLANVAGNFTTNDQIIGLTSGAYTQVNTIFISDVSKGFDTFVQAYKYTGTVISGAFVPNEYLKQTNAVTGITATSLVHSTSTSGGILTVYATDQQDNYSVGGTNTVIGNTSGAELQLIKTYPPELVFRTGDVLYYENVFEIARSNATSETFQTTLSY